MTRYPYTELLPIAERLVQLLEPYTERIMIAGSIRRESGLCKDVEILYIPKMITDPNDLLEERQVSAAFQFLKVQKEAGVFRDRLDKNGHACFGAKYQRLTLTGPMNLPIDFFAATPDTWGTAVVVRTGSAEFSRLCMTSRLLGGYLPSGCQIKDGFKFFDQGIEIPVPEEQDFFRLAELEYIEPKHRKATTQQRGAA